MFNPDEDIPEAHLKAQERDLAWREEILSELEAEQEHDYEDMNELPAWFDEIEGVGEEDDELAELDEAA